MLRRALGAVAGVGMLALSVLALQSVGSTVPVRSLGFSHAAHFAKGMSKDCGSCHGGDGQGALESPGADHAPCNSCHAEEFRKPNSLLCLSCHNDSDPWVQDKPVKALSGGGGSGFVAGFSHKGHAERIDTLKSGDCASCHPTQYGQPAPIPPKPRKGQRGVMPQAHIECAKCHANLAPKMDNCAGCHILASGEAAKELKITPAKWRVGTRFTHKQHLDLGAKCDSCHTNVMEVAPGQPIVSPKKKDCAKACHNGKTAFKVTGHECRRCHGPAPAPTAAP